MEKKLQTIVLRYIKRVKEVPRSQIIDVINRENGYERVDVQEAINILEDDKQIRIVGPADTFALTNKGHKAFTPWLKKEIKVHPIITAIIIGVIIVVLGLIIEYNFFQ